MSLASKPHTTGIFPAGAPTLRGDAPSRPLPRLAAYEPRVVLRLPDCSPLAPPPAELPARPAGRADWAHWSTAGVRPLAAIKTAVSKPRTLLACVVAVSVVLAVVVFVSRAGRQSSKGAHDEPAGAALGVEVSRPIPRVPGVTISTSEGRHAAPAANQPHDTRAALIDDDKSRPAVAPNQGASLAPDNSLGRRGGLPYRTTPTPSGPEGERAVPGPWASLLHEIH